MESNGEKVRCDKENSKQKPVPNKCDFCSHAPVCKKRANREKLESTVKDMGNLLEHDGFKINVICK